jgi:hypothetical protein
MPKFFIPFADPKQRAQIYAEFLRQNPYPPVPGRLFRVNFSDHGIPTVAEVGKTISGRMARDGPVLAIIEGTNLVTIHLVSRDEVIGRLYFDDFPAQP